MTDLHIPIGIPGCGKSTLATSLVEEHQVVCPDDLRLSMTDDMANQSANSAVFDVVRIVVWERIKRGLDTYIDATNLVPSHFMPYIDMTTRVDHDYTIYIHLFNNVDEALSRNRKRMMPVPEMAMNRMLSRYRSLDLSSLNSYSPVKVTTYD